MDNKTKGLIVFCNKGSISFKHIGHQLCICDVDTLQQRNRSKKMIWQNKMIQIGRKKSIRKVLLVQLGSLPLPSEKEVNKIEKKSVKKQSEKRLK